MLHFTEIDYKIKIPFFFFFFQSEERAEVRPFISSEFRLQLCQCTCEHEQPFLGGDDTSGRA